MKPLFFSAFCWLVLTGLSPAHAADDGRYQLQPTPNGIVRLDTHTGELAYCHEGDGTLICNPAIPDDVLARRLEALEQRVTALEETRSADQLPSDEELEKGFSIMEKFMRRFKGLVEEFGGQNEDHPSEPLPQKT